MTMKQSHRFQLPSPRVLRKKARRLVSHPFLIFLAVASNAQILLGATGIYHFEAGVNKEVGSFLDALVWSVGIVTTVGTRDIAPITTSGKIISMVLMILGTATFCAYAALFADALISDEFEDFEFELRGIESRLQQLKTADSNPVDVSDTLARIESHLRDLKSVNSRRPAN
jgi:hypothetical protein